MRTPMGPVNGGLLLQAASSGRLASPSPTSATDQALVDATRQLVTATGVLAALTAALVLFTLVAPLLIWWLQRRQQERADQAAIRLSSLPQLLSVTLG